MADNRILEITNGTVTVKLNDPNDSHWMLERGGYPPIRFGEAHITGLDPISGHTLFQAFTIATEGDDHDAIQAKLSVFLALLRQAVRHHEKPQITSPVWIKTRGRTESSPRYAVVYRCVELELPSEMHKPLDLIHWATEVGFTLEREHPWSSVTPDTLPTVLTLTANDGPANPTRIHAANFRDDTVLTHIYSYDDNLAAFSANLVAESTFSMFEVAGSTPALDDYMVFGSTDEPPRNIVVPLGTAGDTIVAYNFYYSNGGPGWTKLTRGTDYWSFPAATENSTFEQVQETIISINISATWDKDVINGVNAYWFKIAIDGFTSWTISPVTNALCYLQKTNYFEIPSTSLLGEHPLPLLLRCYSANGSEGGITPTPGTLSKVMFGARSRDIGADEFAFFLNAGNADNPASWAVTYGDDTAANSARAWPGGVLATCSFATNTAMVPRVIYAGTGMNAYHQGRFELLVGVRRNTAGDEGDLNLKARIGIFGTDDPDPHHDTPSAPIKHDTTICEVVSLGEIQIPPGEYYTADEDLSGDLYIQIMADRQASASTLDFLGIWLMPIDEWAGALEDPLTDLDYGASSMGAKKTTEFDGGIVHRGARQFFSPASLTGPSGNPGRTLIYRYNYGGALPLVEPGLTTRIYVLMLSYEADWGIGNWHARMASSMTFEVYGKPGYIWMRGAG